MNESLSSPLSQAEEGVFRSMLWHFLARQTELYTAGDSSSVTAETAQELLESIGFVLCLGDGSPARIRELLSSGLETAYTRGVADIEEKIESGRALWKALCLNLPEIESRSMSDTLKSIGSFWNRYDYRFFAHRIPCDIDYQLCRPVSETVLGIDYIDEYLRRLMIENSFLKLFDPSLSKRLLESFRPGYGELLINLFEPVAANALALALTGADPRRLNVSALRCAGAAARLASLTQAEAAARLSLTAAELCDALGIRSEQARLYISSFALSLLPRISACLPQGDLGGIFTAFS